MKRLIPAAKTTRPLLLAGFGGLLLLMTVAALDNLRILHSIQTRSDHIRTDFIERNRLLNNLRSDLYLSGTWVRDYLLEPDPARAASDRLGFVRTREALNSGVAAYSRILGPAGSSPFTTFRQLLNEYFRVVEGVIQGTPEKRTAAGYSFLRDEVYPRRTALVSLADQFGTIDEHDLNTRILQVTELFAGLRVRVTITMLVTLCLGGLLATFTTRRILAYEHSTGEHLAEMEKARIALKDLSTRLVEVQEGERRTISRELHDEVGQSLSALLLTLGNMAAAVPPVSQAALSGYFSSLRDLAERSLRAVRDMALLLRPSMLDDLGLVPALQWLGREASKRSGIAVTVDTAGVPDDLTDSYRTSIYRVVQEAIHNCEKHAKATVVRVTLRCIGGSLVLSVNDDGKGFDADTGRGMGMLGMQERIANLGGTFNVESVAGRGTLIMVKLPMPLPSAERE